METTTATPSPRMLIGGELVAGAQTMDVVNPATGQPFAKAPRASAQQVEQAVMAARQAYPAWAAQPAEERRQLLLRIADTIGANKEELARLITLEQGKPLPMAAFEVAITELTFREASKLELPPEVLEDSTERRVELHRRPLGVVAVITPWNVPLIMVANKVAPALLVGNTVVAKPAGTTPLATLRLGELIAQIVPAGVLNIVSDANDLGDVLTGHPDVRKISFTGSTATGRRVMASAAASLKRITLELGGNDAGLVLEDADLDDVAPKIFISAFVNSGQICAALKRLYVHESIYDELVGRLASMAEVAKVGDGMDPEVEFGPVQNAAQYERVKSLLDDAARVGTIVTGGVVQGAPGYLIRPTIVRDISDGTRLVDEEQFGPVLPVIRYSDVDEVLARINASIYGLGASVWSRNLVRAAEVAARIESGTVWINKHLDIHPTIPFGGAKSSGIGVEFSTEGLREYTQLQVINVAK